MRVVVTTCDQYMHLIKGFAHLFNKYWGDDQQVVVSHFSPLPFDLPANFSSYVVGKQEDYPFGKWSNALSKTLRDMDDEVVCIMLEDYWLRRHVNRDAVEMLTKWMIERGDVIKIDLCGDRLYAWGMRDHGVLGYLDLVISDPSSPYHMSLMTGLWNRKLLLSVLIPGESPHDVEITGTGRLAKRPLMHVIGTRQWPVRHTLLVRRDNPDKELLDELRKEDLAELRSIGALK